MIVTGRPAGTKLERNMIKFWSIIRNTFVETIRQPIYGVLLLATFALLVITLPLTGWTLGVSGDYRETDQKMMENLGLSTLLVSGLLFAAFCASSALSREIETKTALTVISKPVSRTTFVLGKFVGVAAAVTAAFYLCSLVFLMTVRHKVVSAVSDPYDVPVIVLGCGALATVLLVSAVGNYFFGWSFTSTSIWTALVGFSLAMGLIAFIGKEWKIVPFAHDIRPQLIVGMGMMFLGVMVFVAVAVAASTRLGPVLTLLVCLGVFIVGWTHPLLFSRADDILIVRVLGWIAPNLTYLDPQDPLTTDKTIPLAYVGVAAGYCACYVAAVLAAGVALFQRRQLEAQTSSATMPGAVAVLAWTGRLAAVAMGIAALVLLSLGQFHTVRGFVLSGVLLALAAAAWMLWGYFGRGARWSYWLVLVLATLALLRSLAGLFVPAAAEVLRVETDTTIVFVQMAVNVVVLLIVLLPKTRRHFSAANQ